jgi:hypothetical protein
MVNGFSKSQYFLLIIILCIQTLLFSFTNWCGIGLTHDSQHYLSAAQSLIKDGSLLNVDGSIYRSWPPLYPFVLSLGGIEHLLKWALVFQWFCYCVISTIIYFLSWHIFEKKFTQITFFIFTAFSATLLLIHRFAWSEPLFIIVLMGSFICFYKSNFKVTKYFFISILLNNVMCMQRLTGIFFILGFGVCYWLCTVNKFKISSLLESSLYVLLSSVSLIIWSIRNAMIEEKPNFLENIDVSTYTDGILFYAKGFSTWFIPSSISHPLIDLFIFSLLIFYFIYLIYRKSDKSISKVLSVVLLVYIGMMVGINKDVTEDYERYLAPVFIPMFIIVFLTIEKIMIVSQSILRFVMKIVVIIVISYSCIRTVKNAIFWHSSGCGYSTSVIMGFK